MQYLYNLEYFKVMDYFSTKAVDCVNYFLPCTKQEGESQSINSKVEEVAINIISTEEKESAPIEKKEEDDKEVVVLDMSTIEALMKYQKAQRKKDKIKEVSSSKIITGDNTLSSDSQAVDIDNDIQLDAKTLKHLLKIAKKGEKKKKKDSEDKMSCCGKLTRLGIAMGLTTSSFFLLRAVGFGPISNKINDLSTKSWTTLLRSDGFDMSCGTVWELTKKYGGFAILETGAVLFDMKILNVTPVVSIGTSMIVTYAMIASFMKDYKLFMKGTKTDKDD